MALEYLYDRQKLVRVVLLYTPSNSLSIFLQDSFKTRYNIANDSVRSIKTKKDLRATGSLNNIVPFLSDRWFFHVKPADKLVGKDFLKLTKNNTSGIYFMEFENYKSYRDAKKLLAKEQGVLDLYLGFLRRNDFDILYYRVIVANHGQVLPKTLQDFVARGYSGEIESIFDLFEAIKEGQPIKSRKDIIEICGLSSNTIDSFMFSLLKEPTTSDKGLKMYISKRLKEAVDLSEKYTWSKFRSFLKNSVKSCVDIKMILSSGEVYDNIRGYENEGYDTKRLKRYQRHLPKIKEISMTRFLGLLENLDSRHWRSDVDFLNFFFNYMLYKYRANDEVRNMILKSMNDVKEKGKQTVSLSRTEKERLESRTVSSDKLSNFRGG